MNALAATRYYRCMLRASISFRASRNVKEEEGSYDGGGLSNFIRLHGACAGGCGTTPAQNKCLKKAGSNKSQGAKCFGAKGNFREFVEVVNEVIGLVQCVAEDGNCPDFGAPPHA
jgi:hypothetical protein